MEAPMVPPFTTLCHQPWWTTCCSSPRGSSGWTTWRLKAVDKAGPVAPEVKLHWTLMWSKNHGQWRQLFILFFFLHSCGPHAPWSVLVRKILYFDLAKMVEFPLLQPPVITNTDYQETSWRTTWRLKAPAGPLKWYQFAFYIFGRPFWTIGWQSGKCLKPLI